MIESSTALLKEIEETGSLSSSLGRRQINIHSRKYVTELTTRFNIMQGWFMRCSWMEKMKTLTEMFRSLRSLDSLCTILNLLMTIYGSSYTYSSLEASLNFVYDKSLNDHNRAMHPSTLKKVQDADLEWFSTLSDESEQIMILIGLLRLGGGSVLYHMYKRGVTLYQQLLITKGQTRDTRIPTKHRRSHSFSEWPQIDVIINALNINNSFTGEIEKRTQIWNDAMKQYRSKPESPPKKMETKTKKTDKKDNGKQKEDELDWIQLCPITIVKKIFSYLDAKTLNKITSVNKYWSGAVKDFQTDLKSRKVFSKFIVKLQKGIPAADFEIQKRPAKSTTKKRLKRLWERGAASPKLISQFQKSLTELPLLTNYQELDDYILDIKQLKPFPRSCPSTQLPYESLKRNVPDIKDRVLFNPVPSIDSHTTVLLHIPTTV